jgi:hypothetical protein
MKKKSRKFDWNHIDQVWRSYVCARAKVISKNCYTINYAGYVGQTSIKTAARSDTLPSI